ncbi:FAD linked oxidase [Macrophomina phaseolina MS6]|uniref:FAD linked oxidase n=1 Tax=Macrophomina phaseolina (strain MS6) TaxID=1126212 RepID=K2RUG5_MACPH|nr:FAD linked oxidase [Macrophomina phaseolina MS6]
MPGDKCWPGQHEWAQLNRTVGGKLISNVPLAHVCHDPTYDEDACNYLKEQWKWPVIHETSSSDIMSAYFRNASCDPFTPREQPCELGNYPVYSINVSSAADIAAGVKFAQQKNIRLVIKNTGHDFLGKSTGKGSLGLWTHNMNDIRVFKNYNSTLYTGPAVRMGAGVRGAEALPATHDAGLIVVGGSCPSVGLTGGFTQGGGHGALSSSFGMGADQVLEWEVVTADGRHTTATPTKNADLYWALSGGGPGAYAVVVSVTVRAYRDRRIGGAAMSFASTGVSNDTYWKGIHAWQSFIPKLVDAGATASYLISTEQFFLQPLTVPGASENATRSLIKPFTDALSRLNIPFSLNITSDPTWMDHYVRYLGPLPQGQWPVDRLMGGRLIPRQVSTNNTDALVGALRDMAENTSAYLGFIAVQSDAAKAVAPNSILPQWRTSVASALIQTQWNFTAPMADNRAQLAELNDVVIPKIEAVTPGAGAYLNEANFALASWKEDFYGVNYARLRHVKKTWDPRDLFYGPTMVGSDAWSVQGDGRLCRPAA